MNEPTANEKLLSPTTGPAWHRDLLASLVVFLIALPLGMGIAIASGVPVAAGLATGIIGGIVVGFIAGSPLQVSGPAAGLTVIVLGIVQQHGFEMLGLIVLVAGLIQIAAGMGGIGQWFRAVSPAVVEGMLAGIGILIFASQFHVMVDDSPRKNGLQNILSLPEAVRKGLPWPELGPLEHRATRSHWLRELGTLHANQRQVQDHVADVIPQAVVVEQGHGLFAAEEAAEPAEATVKPAVLARLAASQQAVIDEIRKYQIEAAALTDATLGEGRRTDLQNALAKSLTTAEAALADLQPERIASARLSQLHATEAIGAARAKFKSHDAAAKIGLLTIAILLIWQWLPWKKLKLIPGPLVAVTTATVVAVCLALPVFYVELPRNIISDLHLPSLTLLQTADWYSILKSGMVIALVASAETLLCCSAVDQMHQGPRTKYNRELLAQGIGNSLCGLIGALPMTGVIVRSAANVQSGATTRLSTILHGIWLLLFVVFLGSLLRMIPTAALAAMLVFTGVRLVNFQSLRAFWHLDKAEAAIFVITATIVVVEDLLMGVVVGIVLAAVKLLWQFSHLRVDVKSGEAGEPSVISLAGAATFLRLPQLAQVIEKISPRTHAIVDISELTYIDHACLELLIHWQKRHLAAGGTLDLDWELLTSRYRARPAAADPGLDPDVVPPNPFGKLDPAVKH
ncbi:SulP family inorganic anion transporter [Anatilimnocola sp. NA78]|uniref:SulP family inorganic anion transporter n=1 Tax=Anatilimnocola sp. NA78 TaxID=3415683 RepID=UPI003CE4AB17